MKKVLTIIIGFIHDFAAGCWAATVLAVWWLAGREVGGDAVAVVAGLMRQIFYAGLVSVFLVFATGAGRSFTYVDNVYGQDAEKMRKRLLIFKHLFLFLVFGLGIWWQYSLVFK